MAIGHPTQLWTTMIRQKFLVQYHRDHVGRLMHRLVWSHQKPQKRALERKEGEIRRIVRED